VRLFGSKRDRAAAREREVATGLFDDPEAQAELDKVARIVGAVTQEELQPDEVALWEMIAKRQHAVQLAADEILPGAAGLQEESVYRQLESAHGHDLAGLVTYRMWAERVRASDAGGFAAAEEDVEQRGDRDPWSRAKAAVLLKERERRGLDPAQTPMMKAAAADAWLHQQSLEVGVSFWSAEDLTLRQTIWMNSLDRILKESAS
jgi:hypothetical protein